MGRAWEYPRWRRVLMQVVMWLVFAGSLGLARVLSHNRGLDRSNAARVGEFEVLVPGEFKIDSSGPGKDLLAHDTHRNRRLRVQSLALGNGQSMSGRSDEEGTIQFSGLRTVGVLEVRQRISRSDEGDAVLLRLRARAPVPKIKRMVVITLDVGADDPEEDQISMENIAAGVTVAKDVGRVAPSRPSGEREDGQTVD